MTDLNIKAGDEIMYSCALGRVRATVRSITIGATAKPNHSIAWLNITIHADPAKNRRFASNVSLPASTGDLKAFKVELV